MKIHKYVALGLGLLALTACQTTENQSEKPVVAPSGENRPLPIRRMASDAPRMDRTRPMPEIEKAALAMPATREGAYAALDDARARWGNQDAGLMAARHTLLGRSMHALDWMRDVVFLDAGANLTILYADTMWALANASRSNPLRRAAADGWAESAQTMTLVGYTLVIVDGARCADSTAAGARLTKVTAGREDRFKSTAPMTEETRELKRRVARNVETRTASARLPDPYICMDGIAEIGRIMASAGSTRSRPQPATGGQFGSTVVLTPGPDYMPEFRPLSQ